MPVYEVQSSQAILHSLCVVCCPLLQVVAGISDVQAFLRGLVHISCNMSLILETFKQPIIIRWSCFPRTNKSVQTLSCGISGCLYCKQRSHLLDVSVLQHILAPPSSIPNYSLTKTQKRSLNQFSMLSSVAPFYHFLTLHQILALALEIRRLIRDTSVLFIGQLRSFQHYFSLHSLRSLPGMALFTFTCAGTKEQQIISVWVSEWNTYNYCTTVMILLPGTQN